MSLQSNVFSYVGSPIECWLPQTYNNQWAQFSENYCFLKDTYWYPTHEPMGQITITHKEDHRLRYYQWSCMYFAIAAVVCIIPKIFWRLSQNFTDIPILYFCETANKIRNDTAEKRKEKVQEMSELLQTKVVARQHPQFFFTVGPYFVYGFVKWLYLFIAFLQYPAIGIFIGQRSDPFWGWTLARNLYNGITWETTGMFPRITFCDFIVRELAGNNREETVQCVIGINEFNEKIYLFLWYLNYLQTPVKSFISGSGSSLCSSQLSLGAYTRSSISAEKSLSNAFSTLFRNTMTEKI